ncbi:MAG: aldose 1-epimerase [Planctomycetaceae bacterium]|nr:aldose 1-epimerase [Planctomycetaceae bacterium]
MAVVTLADADTGATAQVFPEVGFNCFSFRAMVHGRPVDVLDAVPGFETGKERPTRSGIPILFPFPNRIRAGRFAWEGRDYQLPVTEVQPNAIHGFCFDRPWRVINQGDNFVTGQFQLSVDAPDRLSFWPADFILEVDYELLHNRLRANFRISNPGSRALPWGLGTHAYFKVPLSPESQPGACTVEAPVSHYWKLAESLPTGETLPVDESRDLRNGAYFDTLKLDDVLTNVDCVGPQFDCLIVDERAGLQVTQTCPPIFREIVAFTPPNRNCVCLEPYTCPTDAINLAAQGLDVGWRTLAPGSEFHTWIDISAGLILA